MCVDGINIRVLGVGLDVILATGSRYCDTYRCLTRKTGSIYWRINMISAYHTYSIGKGIIFTVLVICIYMAIILTILVPCIDADIV